MLSLSSMHYDIIDGWLAGLATQLCRESAVSLSCSSFVFLAEATYSGLPLHSRAIWDLSLRMGPTSGLRAAVEYR